MWADNSRSGSRLVLPLRSGAGLEQKLELIVPVAVAAEASWKRASTDLADEATGPVGESLSSEVGRRVTLLGHAPDLQ
jgi:hypothetical protein